jgi:hypothetical protein
MLSVCFLGSHEISLIFLQQKHTFIMKEFLSSRLIIQW